MRSDYDVHEFAQITKIGYLLCGDWDASVDEFNPFPEVFFRSHRFFHDRDVFWTGVFPDWYYGTILGLRVE